MNNVLFKKYHQRDKIQENEMGWAPVWIERKSYVLELRPAARQRQRISKYMAAVTE
jgi:hypothetical protein